VNLFGKSSVIHFEDSKMRYRMEKLKRRTQIIAAVLIPLFVSACFNLQIIKNVKKPDRYFKKAYREIEGIHRNNPDREGRPRKIHVLIYEGSDRNLIQVTAPLWLVNGCMDFGADIAENDNDFDFEDRFDFDWSELKNLGQVGPGLLVEVNDLEEKTKILIWLK
jgi:hypothetical protein